MAKKKKQAPTEVESIAGSEIAPGQVTLEEAIENAENEGQRAALKAFSAHQTAVERAQEEADIAAARSDYYCRVSLWMLFLPISRLQQIILGRIYSFQCSFDDQGRAMTYHPTLKGGADELGMRDRRNLLRELAKLCELGFVTKVEHGPRKSPDYLVNEHRCMEIARQNGWLPADERRPKPEKKQPTP